MKLQTRITSFVLTASTLPILAFAAPTPEDVPAPSNTILGTEPQGVLNLLDKIGNWAFSILLAVAVIFVLIAAFNYLTSVGNSEKASKANKMLVYAVLAIAVGALSKLIVTVVKVIVKP